MKKEKKELSFEQGLIELQKKVQLLEKGDFPLEEALKSYEDGVRLARECQVLLKNAEQKVTQLKNLE